MAGVGILVTGVSMTVKRLSVLVENEISLIWDVKKELQKLNKTLNIIMAALADAEKKQIEDEAVRLWLEELKDIAYEAEDILDEHTYEVIRQREMTRKRDRLSSFLSSSNSIVFRRKVAHEIKNINKNLNDHALLKKIFLGFEKLTVGPKSGPMDLDEKNPETDSSVDPSLEIVGRDNDKSNIINMLFDNNNPHNQGVNIQVIPIVGMGGLGKTTLAQLIYNDNTVKKHFELQMWVCVSNDFNVKKLFVKIIESITKDKCVDVSNNDVLARELQRHLKGKKYLLVLDNVWNKKREEWVNFRKPLLVGANGSKIIVTTRSDVVASIMDGRPHSYKLEILEEHECWSLFKKKTFGNVGGVVENPSLTAIGKELVRKCGGLPLAIIFLGNLLRYKEENEWRVINENNIWNQSFDEDASEIMPILKLSYNHLPSHLKQCFSYFSIFPKNYVFFRTNVILSWMAEGFIVQPCGENKKSIEEVGNEYFNSLLFNSFIMDVDKDVLGEIMSFTIHDLVHDLAKYVAGDRECLISLEAHENIESVPNVRRLGLDYFDEGMSKTVFKVLQDKPKLRTLVVVDGTVKKIEKNAFDGTKRLRLLDLHDTPDIEHIPSSLMVNLKHLRYLDLSNTKVTKLPKLVTRLFHLQTIKLWGCVNLKELPKGIEKLINLRHLFLPDHINLPREIGQLSSLQTLDPCTVGNKDGVTTRSGGRGCGIEVLEGLNLLNGYLIINDLRNVRSGIEAQRANLMEKKNLDQIFLSWHKYNKSGREDEVNGEYNKDEVVFEALQPHPRLKKLMIDQYFGAKLPWWMGVPSCLPNLVYLLLQKCTKCEQLVGFGKLPSLQVLQLNNMDGIKCLGNEFYYSYNNFGGSSSSSSSSNTNSGGEVVLFPSLKWIILEDMVALEEWVDINPTPTVAANYYSCFPCLEWITIRRCPDLRITPTRFSSPIMDLTLEEVNVRVAMPIITTNLNSLFSVELVNISELIWIPLSLLQGNKLGELKVHDCLDFQGFQEEEGFTFPEIDHQSEEEEEEEARSFSIVSLSLLDLPNLKFLPDIRSFTSLKFLTIEDCESLKPLPEDLTCLPSSLEHLKWVEIQNVNEVEDFIWQK